MIKLFIDDIRSPHDVIVGAADDWNVVRDYDSAMAFIREKKPQRISFDHDLSFEHYAGRADEKTGYTIARDLVDLDMADPEAGYITRNCVFTCHSANPDGKRNILMLLEGYYNKKFRGGK